MEKQRRGWDTTRPKYAVYRRRRRNALLVLVVLLATLTLGSLVAHLFSGTAEEDDEALDRVVAPTVEQEAPEPIAEETAAEKKAAEEEEARLAAMPPEDPTLFLTVPRLGIQGHTVRNDRSEAALDLGAVKLPSTGFPWEKEDTNTYIACHRLGWPGTESFNQCLNLPSMQQGDEVSLADTNGRVYRYRVSDILIVSPEDTWVAQPVAGKDVISLQTCIENPNDVFTLGPNWLARYVVRAERVA